MKAWIFSDLHLEVDPTFRFNSIPDADICLCVGDIKDQGVIPSLKWLADEISPHMPVLFVAGNHEYYKSSMRVALQNARLFARDMPNVTFLHNRSVVIGGTRFIGTTLWTDYNILGDRVAAIAAARRSMNDHARIFHSKVPFARFTPEHALQLHLEAVEFLDAEFSNSKDVPTVVLSHHLPSALSVHEKYKHDAVTPAFASSLDDRILAHQPMLWVHCHAHEPVDYHIGQTRVICNPLGYPSEDSRKTFDAQLVIDLNAFDDERHECS